MAFYATAYDTTAARSVSTTKITSAISQAIIQDNIVETNNKLLGLPMAIDGCTASVLTTRTDSEMAVPVFPHPIYVDMKSLRGSLTDSYMVVDCRAFMPMKPLDPTTNQFKVKNLTEFEFAKNRALLSSHWYKQKGEGFKHLAPELVSIYSSWISETISRRFGLDPNDQNIIAIIAGYHYLSLFYPYSKFSEQDKVRMAPMIARTTYSDIETVLEILDNHPDISGIEGMVAIIKEVTQNSRLTDLNVPLLISMIATSWAGMNSREIAAVALEHVPTFIMMCFGAFTERGYKHSSLSKITERFKGRKGEDNFIRNLKRLIDTIKGPVDAV